MQEKETLERLREELDREKERIRHIALTLKTRSQEVEAFSKVISRSAGSQHAVQCKTSDFWSSQLAAERYEAGERALQEAKRVEAGHEVRLKNIHSRTEHLRQLEQRMLKVRVWGGARTVNDGHLLAS